MQARKLQELLERGVLKGFLQGLIWRYKHIYQNNWPQTSLTSKDLPHRRQLISEINCFGDIKSLLEIGCAGGPNLRLIRENNALIKLTGIDINKKAIHVASNYFTSVNDNNISFFTKKAHQLDIFSDKIFDVVLAQRVMVCIPPCEFKKTIKEILRVTRVGVVFNEYHLEGAIDGFFYSGRWVYDYKRIIENACPNAIVSIQKTDFNKDDDNLYGQLITVKFK